MYAPQPGWLAFLLKVLAGSGFMAVVLHTSMGEASWWLAVGWERKLPAIVALVLAGAAAYAVALLVLGVRPRDFSRRAAV
jgi:putative peptidoglycan lipid II flippase